MAHSRTYGPAERAVHMTKSTQTLTLRYQAGMRLRLGARARPSAGGAGRLGSEAMELGLEVLDLARIHGEALLALMPLDGSAYARDKAIRQASGYFLEVLAPIERRRGAEAQSVAALRNSNESLRQRTSELSAANLRLKAEVVQRAAAERSLRESELQQAAMLDESRRMQARLRHLSHQVLSAQEEERKRISRELHDVIAQTLTGINVRLAALKKEAAINTNGLDRNIARTQRLVEKSVGIVHEFARELRPAALDDLGLIPALHSFVKLFSKRTRIHVHLKVFAGVEQLPGNQRTILYRVAQEALTNVSRHAHASRVEVGIQKVAEGICLKIADNGKSFEVERVLNARGAKRLGLLGMRERVEMVGGRFTVESVPGTGTTISALIPLEKNGVGESPLKSGNKMAEVF